MSNFPVNPQNLVEILFNEINILIREKAFLKTRVKELEEQLTKEINNNPKGGE